MERPEWKRIENTNSPGSDFTTREYLFRWMVPAVVLSSLAIIPTVFILISGMEKNDVLPFYLHSLFLLSLTWLGFWCLRFSRFRTYASLYLGFCGLFYILVNFVPLFKSRAHITGDAIQYMGKGSRGGFIVAIYIFIFFYLFMHIASFLEKESLKKKLTNWTAERFTRKK